MLLFIKNNIEQRYRDIFFSNEFENAYIQVKGTEGAFGTDQLK